ncbi:metal ABC transporter permease [Candidatus Fermentibacteria bacterium]|nr:metal ABC transporter permease [Candidatus Fermentibacteria bacterium]
MIEAILSYGFMQNAFLAALLGAVAAGIVGTLISVNRLSSLTGSVAHASFGGLGLAYMLGFSPLIGALTFSLAAALGIGAISSRYRERSDTAIAAFWAIGMALGLVFIKLSEGYAVDLMSYLFGSIMAVPGTDLMLMAVLDVIVVLFVVGLFKELLAISYDPEFATIQGLRVRLLYLTFLCLVALTVVMLIRVVGLIMVIAMLAIPPAIARMFMHDMRRIMWVSMGLSALLSMIGLSVAWYLELPGGASIILVAGVVYFAALGTQSAILRRQRA